MRLVFTLKCLFVLFKQGISFMESLSPLINYCVFSLRKQHITSCFVFISERKYKKYSYALRPLTKDFREI